MNKAGILTLNTARRLHIRGNAITPPRPRESIGAEVCLGPRSSYTTAYVPVKSSTAGRLSRAALPFYSVFSFAVLRLIAALGSLMLSKQPFNGCLKRSVNNL